MEVLLFTKDGNLISCSSLGVSDLYSDAFVFQFDSEGNLQVIISTSINQKIWKLLPLTSYSFDGEFATDYDDAKEKIETMFNSSAGDVGLTLDQVMANSAVLTADRDINSNGHTFTVDGNPFVSGLASVLNSSPDASGAGMQNLGNISMIQGMHIIMISPNGTTYVITVSDEGVLTVTAD